MLSIQAADLDFGASDIDQSLTLSSQSSSPVDWVIDVSATWLSVTPSSGTLQPPSDSVVLRVTVNRIGQSEGRHNATVTVRQQSDGQPMDTATVWMDVTTATYPEVDLGVVAGWQSKLFPFAVTAHAGETVRWAVDQTPAWLGFVLESSSYTLSSAGTVVLELAIYADATGQLPGPVTGSVRIDTNQGPRIYPVRMTAVPPPDLILTAVDLDPVQPQAMEQSEFTIGIKNIGGSYQPINGQYDLEVKMIDSHTGDYWLYRLRSAKNALPAMGHDAVEYRTWKFMFTQTEADQMELTLFPFDVEGNSSNNTYLKDGVVITPSGDSILECVGLIWNVLNVYLKAHAIEIESWVEFTTELALTESKLLEIYGHGGDIGEILHTVADLLVSLGLQLAEAVDPAARTLSLARDVVESIKGAWQCGSYLGDLLIWIQDAMFNRHVDAEGAVADANVNLYVQNSTGQGLGFLQNGTIVNQIAGAQAYQVNEFKTVWAPGDDLRQVKVWGAASRSADGVGGPAALTNFTLALVEGDERQQVRYQNVPLYSTSAGTIDLTDEAYLLQIDDDGDGSVERTVAPSQIGTSRRTRVFLPVIFRNPGPDVNTAPDAPFNPYPAQDAVVTNPGSLTLSWHGGDPDGDPVTYDLYLEAYDTTPSVMVARQLAAPSYQPVGLLAGTDYYWSVVARDAHGAVSFGPVWHFVPLGWREVGAGSARGGGISHNDGGSGGPSVAVAADGTPYVAWYDNSSGNYEIYVRRWNGTHWEEVGTGSATGGGISKSAGLSYWPSLAIAPDGRPYVAWQDDTAGNEEIYVRRWNGGAWEEVGAGSATGGGISNNSGSSRYPSLAIAPDGQVVVAWEDYSSGSEIYVRRWNGSSWEEMGVGSASGGGVSNTSGASWTPSLAIKSNAAPYAAYVAWDDTTGSGHNIYVRRWTGSTWAEVGAGSASGGGVSNTGKAILPSLAIAYNGTVYVAWQGTSGGSIYSEIYVRKWNEVSWQEAGPGSASGGGISNNAGTSNNPSLAVDSYGQPYVAWDDDTVAPGLTTEEIYVRRWRGSGLPWEEVGTNSATAGGISYNSARSWHPSLASGPDGTIYAAWEDLSGGHSDIYVRRWIGP